MLLLWQRLKASASRIVSVNVPQRFLRLLYTIIGSCSSLVLVASVIVGTRLVVLESEEETADKNQGPAQQSHRYRRANCYTSIC